jgi:ATP-dependent Clp protease ATP-binding subunit ClpX
MHKTGARELRTIVEEVLLDVMYEIPSQQDIRRCKITEKVILKEESPVLEPVRLPAREELLVQDEPA